MPENNTSNPIPEDTDLPQPNPVRGQVLNRLWEIAYLGPEITRGSISGQVKALSLIIAIEGLIPDRRAASARNKPTPPPVTADIYEAEWLRNQRSGKNMDSEPAPPAPQEEAAPEPEPAPAVAAPVNPSQEFSPVPRVPMADYLAPDTRVPFFIKKNRFGPRR
jgi:hypothetical protein